MGLIELTMVAAGDNLATGDGDLEAVAGTVSRLNKHLHSYIRTYIERPIGRNIHCHAVRP